MVYGIIYKITNLKTNKVYIGQTIRSLKERWDEYKYGYKNSDTMPYIFNSMRKHGIENFKIEIIEECNSLEELNKREIYWIDYYHSSNYQYGYNLTEGGLGGKPNEEVKKKMSKNMKKYYKDNPNKLKERGQKISESLIETYKNPTKAMKERYKKHSESLKGRKMSEDQKKKISETMKRKIKEDPLLKEKIMKNLNIKVKK